MMRRNCGIALVQVLIISVILIMLSVFIGQTLKSQINVARDVQKVHQLRLKLETAEALVFNALLSNFNYQNKKSDNDVARIWNFYFEPFEVDDITVQIQDVSGLYSLNTFDSNHLKKLFQQLGVAENRINIFIDSLLDWTDKDDSLKPYGAEKEYYQGLSKVGPRNGYLQSVNELQHVRESDILTVEQWNKYFTVEPTPFFNPMNSPEAIIKAIAYDESGANRIIKQRREGNLSRRQFEEMSGIEQEGFVSFANGFKFKVAITASENGIMLQKSFIIELKRRDINNPVTITDLVWNKL